MLEPGEEYWLIWMKPEVSRQVRRLLQQREEEGREAVAIYY